MLTPDLYPSMSEGRPLLRVGGVACAGELKETGQILLTADTHTLRPCADRHWPYTHTHTPLCGYGFSIRPTEGLSLWLPSIRSSQCRFHSCRRSFWWCFSVSSTWFDCGPLGVAANTWAFTADFGSLESRSLSLVRFERIQQKFHRCCQHPALFECHNVN